VGTIAGLLTYQQGEWLVIASKFEERWNFANCLAAMDGKHIVIQPPPNSGSHYYNYKHTHSIILMAIAGPDYECLYADMGGCQMEVYGISMAYHKQLKMK